MPDYFENMDLTNIVTPVQVDKLVELLVASNYPTQEVEFLQKGFSDGFDIGYEGPQKHQSVSRTYLFQ